MKLKGNQLLITTSRLQNYINGITNTNDVKYRLILIEDVNKLLQGTPCKKGNFNKPLSPIYGGNHPKSPSFKPTTPRLLFGKPTSHDTGSSARHYRK